MAQEGMPRPATWRTNCANSQLRFETRTFEVGIRGIMPKQKEKEGLVVGSKVKAVISADGMRSDGELVSAISDKIHEMVEAAKVRCRGNNRNTVRPHDL